MTPAQKAALPGMIAEIERHRALKAAELTAEREVFAAAKKLGLDGKAIRRVIQRRAEDPAKREDFEATVGEYEIALAPGLRAALEAVEGGASVNGAAAANGVPRSNLRRLAGVAKNTISGHPPHDAETGEITESAAGASTREDEERAVATRATAAATIPALNPAADTSIQPSTAGDGDAGSGSGTIPPPGPASAAAPVQDEAPAVETAAEPAPDACKEIGAGSLRRSDLKPAGSPEEITPVYTPRVAPLAAVAAPAMPPIPTFLRRGVRI